MTNDKRPSLYEMVHAAHDSRKAHVFKDYLTELTMAARWPQNAVLELLPMCNLACKMCYIRMSSAEAEAKGGILRLEEWQRIIDGCLSVGTLNFTLTGGECLLHPDFLELYNGLYEHTPYITLMTNAALMTQEHIDLFRRKKPYCVIITVYGASAETYGRLCGNALAYERVMWALNALKENEIPFRIQMTVVKDNVEDMADVIQMSKALDVHFSYMDSLTSFGNATDELCGRESTEHSRVVDILKREMPVRQTPAETKEKEAELLARRKAAGKPSRPGIRCNAGRNTLCITWQGEMKPCTVLDAYKVSVLNADFRQCWEDMVAWADSLCVVPECYACEYATKCVTCIAQHYNDTHDFSKPSPRLCWKIKNGITS